MHKTIKIASAALFLIVIVALSGCTVLQQQFETPASTATTAPAPSKTATIAPTVAATAAPGSTVEQQYRYTEKLQAGIDKYNAGILLMSEGRNQAHNQSDWANASATMLKAKDHMDQAGIDFLDMGNFSVNEDEAQLSREWVLTADYSATSLQYASDAYAEMAVQLATKGSGPINPVKYNSYIQQANYYNSLAMQSRADAEEIEQNLTFLLSGL